jgi:hypothetical protein
MNHVNEKKEIAVVILSQVNEHETLSKGRMLLTAQAYDSVAVDACQDGLDFLQACLHSLANEVVVAERLRHCLSCLLWSLNRVAAPFP